MHRLAALVTVFALGVWGVASAQNPPPQKQRPAPAAQTAKPTVANRPAWAAPQQCFTDEGYGRFVPCDIGDGR